MKHPTIPLSAVVEVINAVYENRKNESEERGIHCDYDADALEMRKLSHTFAYGEHMFYLLRMTRVRISAEPSKNGHDWYDNENYTHLETMPTFWRENICYVKEMFLNHLDFSHSSVKRGFEGLFVKNSPMIVDMQSCKGVDFEMLGPKFPRTVTMSCCCMKSDEFGVPTSFDSEIRHIEVVVTNFCILRDSGAEPHADARIRLPHSCQMPTNVETLKFDACFSLPSSEQLISMFEHHSFPRLKTAIFHIGAYTMSFRTADFVRLFDRLKHVTSSKGFSVSMTGGDEDDDIGYIKHLFKVTRRFFPKSAQKASRNKDEGCGDGHVSTRNHPS